MGGIIFVIVAMFAFGFITGRVDSSLSRSNWTYLSVVIYAITLVTVFHLFRQGTLGWTFIVAIVPSTAPSRPYCCSPSVRGLVVASAQAWTRPTTLSRNRIHLLYPITSVPPQPRRRSEERPARASEPPSSGLPASNDWPGRGVNSRERDHPVRSLPLCGRNTFGQMDRCLVTYPRTFLIARISDSGAGNNISRFIAVRVKAGDTLDLRNITIASLIITTAPSILLTLVTAPIIGLFVTAQFGSDLARADLWALAWLGLLNSVLAAAANILLAICEGVFQLNYKSIVVISSNAVCIIALVPLLHVAGPAGLGWVYVVLSGTQLFLAALRVTKLVRTEPSLRYTSVNQLIRGLWRENLHLSGIALVRLCFEPVTNFFSVFSLRSQR